MLSFQYLQPVFLICQHINAGHDHIVGIGPELGQIAVDRLPIVFRVADTFDAVLFTPRASFLRGCLIVIVDMQQLGRFSLIL